MKVKCINTYQDLKLNKLINIGEKFEVTDARAKELMMAKVCEALPDQDEAAPKKRASKKKVED